MTHAELQALLDKANKASNTSNFDEAEQLAQRVLRTVQFTFQQLKTEKEFYFTSTHFFPLPLLHTAAVTTILPLNKQSKFLQ